MAANPHPHPNDARNPKKTISCNIIPPCYLHVTTPALIYSSHNPTPAGKGMQPAGATPPPAP